MEEIKEKLHADACCNHDDHDGCCHGAESEETGLPQIAASAVLFIAALILSRFTIPAVSAPYQKLPQLVLYFAAYMLCGLSVVKSAVWNLFHGNIFDEKFLMALASIAALAIGEYPEAVGVMLFYQIGEFFQDYAVDKTHDSINAVLKLRPDTAHLLAGSTEQDVPPEQVQPGQTIIVRPGERIPLDGIITKGSGYVDTSAQTGEPVPRRAEPGQQVLAGYVNTQGALEIKVTKPFGESSTARILELIEHAVKNKAKSERLITRFARVYTPAVCAAALLITVVPSLFTGSWHTWLYRGIIFLVVSCPCALVVSVPLSFFGGIGSASRKGILIKGSNYLELLADAKTAVFDKTGTLTKGNFIVTDIHLPADGTLTEQELVAIAAHAEKYSTHPISKSLRTAHHGACCETAAVENVQEISGQGLKVTVDGQAVLAGNETLMQEQRVAGYSPCPRAHNGTIVHVAVNGTYAGHIIISDEIKEDAARAIEGLKALGITDTIMLTGDNSETARKTADALGIGTVHAGLLPEDKLTHLESCLAARKSRADAVIYIGDGINDAPVLARADVGIAMNALGSDAAIEAADVVLMTDEPSRLCDAVTIARRTVRIARQNIIGALGVKAVVMLLGAAGITGMWTAVFGDVGVLILAILNAMRLLM